MHLVTDMRVVAQESGGKRLFVGAVGWIPCRGSHALASLHATRSTQ